MPDRGTQSEDEADSVDPKVMHGLARYMAENEDSAIFRRFDDANVLSLLCLQSEIQKLYTSLNNKCPDRKPDQPSWASYAVGADPQARTDEEDGRLERERRSIMTVLRRTLKDYNEALLAYNQVKSLDTPDRAGINGLSRFVGEDRTEQSLPDEERACWDRQNEDDFVVVRSDTVNNTQVIDGIRFMCGIIYYRIWGHRNEVIGGGQGKSIVVAEEDRSASKTKRARKAARESRLIMALFGGIALIVPTVVMAKTGGVNSSLITTSVATVVFAVIIAFTARDATGKDVLAATAAYTAVLVVFVGTSISEPGTETGA